MKTILVKLTPTQIKALIHLNKLVKEESTGPRTSGIILGQVYPDLGYMKVGYVKKDTARKITELIKAEV